MQIPKTKIVTFLDEGSQGENRGESNQNPVQIDVYHFRDTFRV